MTSAVENTDKHVPTYRWHEDSRIASIVPAAPGWLAVFRKSEAEGHNPKGLTIHDLAWVEPIACFALVERIEREQISSMGEYGEEWTNTGRTECDLEPAGNDGHFHYATMEVIWLHSGEARLTPSDELMHGDRPDLILGPIHDMNAQWVLERLR